MNDRAARIANLTPEQRRLLESMLQEHAQEERADEGIPALPRHSESGRPAVFPLSSSQRPLWFAEPGTLTHGTPAMRLRGPLDVAALEASLREIRVRHEALRTTFGTRDGEPVQIVGPPRPVPLTRVDLRELLPPAAREEEAARLLAREAQRPFDLSRDPMLPATLLRLDDEEHVLLLVIHHIACDGRSLEVLFQELWDLYGALRSGERASLPELPVQYADYAVWQRQRLRDGALQRSMEYWKKQLADEPEALDVPTDRPGPSAGTPPRGAWQELRMPASLPRELHALCRRQNVTLFVTLLAAWAALLHRYSGQEDILIFAPFTNRNRAELEGLIGFFANNLLLRHDLAGDPSFAGLLGRVRETALDAFSHGEWPWEELLKELRHELRAAFFVRNIPCHSRKLEGLRVERIDLEIDRGESWGFLALAMIEDDEGLRARLFYNADLFEAATVARMLGHLRTLLESVAADPEQRLSKLPLPIRPALLESVVGSVSL